MPTSAPLDPKHPWITDPAELFARMNLIAVYFDPFGKTPRTHFRRAWIILFLIGVATAILALITLTSAIRGTPNIILSIVLMCLLAATTVATFCLHIRRARDAGRSPFWTILVLIPAFCVIVTATAGAPIGRHVFKVMEAVHAYQADAEALKVSDPAAYALAVKTIEARKARAERARQGRQEAGGENATNQGDRRQRGRRGRGRRGGDADATPSEVGTVVQTMAGFAIPAWALPSFIIMFWSIFAAGRWPSVDTETASYRSSHGDGLI